MTDPTRWAVLGQAIRSDRERQGLTREALVDRVKARGGQVTTRSIGSLEAGVVPKKRPKPPTLEPVVAALGWKPGWTDRILAGEDPNAVLRQEEAQPEAAGQSPRGQLLELVPGAYRFSRTAAQLGAPATLRDAFDTLVQELLDSVTAGQSSYSLAAYRPHAEGEGVPADDAERIRDALNGKA